MFPLQNKIAWELVSLLFLVAIPAVADISVYSACQAPTPNPLDGCPKNTLVVSSTPGDCSADFSTIQGAIDSLDNTTSYTILIKPGNYIEQVNVTRSGPLTLLGQTQNPTQQANNTVTIYWASADVSGRYTDNAYTSVLTVAPTLNASLTGSGNTGFPVPVDNPFGCTDFRVYNIDIRNIYADLGVGPSLAIGISRANAGFYYSGIYSNQDTVYIGKLGNVYFYGSHVGGQTDFFYGFGTAWIQHSWVELRGCGGGIIAWKGTNTTFPNKYGAYISESTVNAANSSVATSIFGKCFLGRPWNYQHRSVYLNNYLDASINRQGYEKWSSNPLTDNYNNYTIMAEYNDYGPGYNYTARILGNVTQVLNTKQASIYATPNDVFMAPDGLQPYISWIDNNFYPFN